MALLASLFYLVKYIQPVTEPVAPGKVVSRQEKPAAEAEGDAPSGFNPEVVAPLPDVNKGYVFSEKRKYEKEDPANAAKVAQVEQGPDPLTTVLYSGSIISGDLRRALVIYQELPRDAAPRRSSPGRAQPPAAGQGEMQKKQLNQGDRFLGYVVEAVEPDRIVFAKGDRKVEKFLYDREKKRIEPPEVSQRQVLPTEISGVPIEAIAPPDILAAMMAPSTPKRPPQRSRVSGPTAVAGTPAAEVGSGQAPQPPNRVIRRSQRLMGIDSSLNIPVTPVPGLPVPNN
jgi:hypothetical protein